MDRHIRSWKYQTIRGGRVLSQQDRSGGQPGDNTRNSGGNPIPADARTKATMP
jgi:hypothetical protein